MKKIAFIIPYFGKLKNYFQLFLESCKYNETIDWIIFTDDHFDYKYPKNVHVNYCTFNEIREKFIKKFNFKISLDKPYKLCDYKPTYGYVFSEYLSEYDFWGFCDIDLIWGDIRQFYTEELLDKFDKIGFYGHSTIFRNNEYINKLFMKKIGLVERYKEVYTTNVGCSFDEELNNSINNIFLDEGILCDFNEYCANIYRKSSNFKLVHYNFEKSKYEVEKNKKCFFVFNHGKLWRYDIKNRDKKEFLYIHMQSRKMKINTKDFELYKIVPNSFDSITYEELEDKKIRYVKIKHFNLHYFIHRFGNLKKKIYKGIRKKWK